MEINQLTTALNHLINNNINSNFQINKIIEQNQNIKNNNISLNNNIQDNVNLLILSKLIDDNINIKTFNNKKVYEVSLETYKNKIPYEFEKYKLKTLQEISLDKKLENNKILGYIETKMKNIIINKKFLYNNTNLYTTARISICNCYHNCYGNCHGNCNCKGGGW